MSCINLQLPILILKKSIISDTHHRITYIIYKYIKLYIIHLACKYAIIVSHNSVLVVCIFIHGILFDLFVYIQSETLIKYYISIYISIYLSISIFSKIGLVDQSKTVHTNVGYLQKSHKLHKFATTNSDLKKNQLFQTCVIV